MKKPKGITITPEQFAAIQNFAKAFAPPSSAPPESGPVIEVPNVGTTKNKRKTARQFWTDGTHAHLRRKKATPAMVERCDEKIKTGEYTHVRTSDDVEIYKIAEWSNLRRKKLDVSQCSPARLESVIVRAACKGDYRLYYDACSEYAYRIKNATSAGVALPADTTSMMYQKQMLYLEQRIMRRGGPSPIMIQQELKKIRKDRTGTTIFVSH